MPDRRFFGDSKASLYTLRNAAGMEVTLTEMGAAVVSMNVPLAGGGARDVVLGYDSVDGYKNCGSYFGVTIGRIANRIGGASFAIGGDAVNMDKNEGGNSLHSGRFSYANRMWEVDGAIGGSSVAFRLYSPDGDQGMPGNAEISVRYTLTEDNGLEIRYRAVADKPTVFNLTNHSYFNLAGHDAGAGGSLAQFLKMGCSAFTPVDREFIPTGEICQVAGTPMDFTGGKQIGEEIDAGFEQLRIAGGYDHNYVIDEPSLDKPFAVMVSGARDLGMKAYTDMPGVQFYSGNNLGNDPYCGKHGKMYERRGAVCLETQFFPDTPNKSGFPPCFFAPGEAFSAATVYKFFTDIAAL
ncbi:MAG: galactose mutarotase [Clostridiales Family XIII bacterium]|nr:galactose mutarotase [Clostridiales Family XIII bacterium]